MAEELPHGLYSLVNTTGNQMKTPAGVAVSASTPVFVDSNSNLQVGNIPFSMPLMAGVTSTSATVVSVEGSSTGSANELMHQTLVAGANVTTFTSGGFLRVAITDDAGNITNGSYYIQFGTLS